MAIELQENEPVLIEQIADLLIEISCTLMTSGAHTMRINQNIARMAETFGYTAELSVFQLSIMMTLMHKENPLDRITLIRKTKPLLINYSFVSEISSLSWNCFDQRLSYAKVKEEYEKIIQQKRISRWTVLILVAFANAAFCGLFHGDLAAMGLVFGATLIGFYVRQVLISYHWNHLFVFTVSAFIASISAGLGYAFEGITTTPDIAVGASVLYLVPGVPMINSMLDIIQGHILTGTARLVNAISLIVCIAMGMFLTMIILGLVK
ncbi:MAG: threonine/serine exporter family protein [Paludibacter sp.]|nr:threonine/serine exporter family protein [Paludibacter sp.]